MLCIRLRAPIHHQQYLPLPLPSQLFLNLEEYCSRRIQTGLALWKTIIEVALIIKKLLAGAAEGMKYLLWFYFRFLPVTTLILKMTKRQNKKSCCVNLVTAVMRLLKKNVPSLTFFEHKGELKFVGSHSMSKWFTDLNEDLKEDLRLRMVSDIVNLNDKGEGLLINTENVPEKVSATNLFKSLTETVHTASGAKHLPYPLSLMSSKEKRRYVHHLMQAEAREKKVKIDFGAENCRPELWLEELWPWSNLNKSVFLVNDKNYTGKGTWTQFLSKTIQAVFEARSLDPETHVEDLHLKKKTLEKRKKFLGVHEAPSIVAKQSTTEGGERTQLSNPVSVSGDERHSMQQVSQIISTSLESEPGSIITIPLVDLISNNTELDISESNCIDENLEQIDFQSLTSELYRECFFCQSPLLAAIATCQAGHKLCRICIESSVKDLLASGGGMVVRCLGQCDREVPVDQLSHVLEPDVLTEYVMVRKAELSKYQKISHSHRNITESDLEPRRNVHKSPFKTPSHQPNHRVGKVRIPLERMSEKPLSRTLAPKFRIVPLNISDQLKGCVLEFNSGGGPCLYKAAAQHCSKYCLSPSDVSYKDLRKYAHGKLMEWWGNFSRYFMWPMTVTIGTGENSERRDIVNESEYFKFLLSEESLESFSETEVDMWVLSYILNTTICVLSYNLPQGQGFEGQRFEWCFFEGMVNMPSIYACKALPLYLLHEHLVHYSRIASDEEADESPQEVEVAPLSKPSKVVTSKKVSKKASAEIKVRNVKKSSRKGAGTGDVGQHDGGRVPGHAGRYQEAGEVGQVNQEGDRAAVGEKGSHAQSSNPILKTKKVLRRVQGNSRKHARAVNISLPQEGGLVPGHAAETLGPDKADAKVKQKSKTKRVVVGEKGINAPSRKTAETVNTCDKEFRKVPRCDGEKARFIKGRETTVMEKRKDSGKLKDPKRNRKNADNTENNLDCNDQIKYLSKSYQVGSTIKDIFDEEIANKSDMYDVFVLKQKSLWEVIEPPSAGDIFEEERLEAQSREIFERRKKSEAEIVEIQKSITEEKARQVQTEKRMAANKLRRNLIEAELSQPLLVQMLEKNKEYFEKIMKRDVESYRFIAYFESGLSRSALRFLMISNPFTEEQISLCLEEITKILQTGFKELTETDEFVNSVMLPECLIKIYGDYFEVNKKEAEKMISETPLHAVDDSSADESSGDD